jgi:hypothetical protein
MWRVSGAVCALALAGLAVGAAAKEAPSVTGVQVIEQPASVRVVVTLTGGRIAAREGMVQALDADPSDGRAAVEIAGAAVPGRTTVTAAGVRARPIARPAGAVIRLDAPAKSFKFVSYRAASRGTRLVIDLWKAASARRDQAILDDGCLRLTAWNGGRKGRASARGLELRPLFEHGLVLAVRDATGRRLGLTPVTATEGRFKPDFSGYLTPGRWNGSVRYAVSRARRGSIEAWSLSARDGALECLVQVPVVLRPAGG